MKLSFEEATEELDMQFFLERESIPFKMSRGASGMQINVKTCPACGDSRYRTYLNAETGLGNCFVCNQPLTKLRFVHLLFGHDKWSDTMRVVQEVLKDQGWRPKRTATAAVDETTADFKMPFSHELPTPDGNLLYLEQRGMTPELTRYFNLRWCEFGWFDYVEDGEKRRQMFDNTVIIPVYDLDGTLKTFQGRDLTDRRSAKYLFPKGLPGTGRYLFNGHNVHATAEVAMGEGAFDVVAMKAAFDTEVSLRHVVPVGSFGKHMSYGSDTGDDQLGRFIRLRDAGVQKVTIMWDGEAKALIAALDAAKLLNGIGLTAAVAMLPADKDPNEVLPEVVCNAYFEAKTWTPTMDIKLRLRNPYSGRKK